MANNADHLTEKPALLLTRPRARAAQFLSELDPAALKGVRVVVSPLVEIVPTGVDVDFTGCAGAIFTSLHGPFLVEHGAGRIAYCVGASTARVAAERGWEVLLIAETADDLVAQLRQVNGPLMHVSGQHRRGQIADRLTAQGVPVRTVVVYQQPAQNLTKEAQKVLAGKAMTIIPIFSPRTAQLFSVQAQNAVNLRVIAMSAAVSAQIGANISINVHIAAAPTGAEMRYSVEMALISPTLP
jgi:uroporphyrinogen-III synthase